MPTKAIDYAPTTFKNNQQSATTSSTGLVARHLSWFGGLFVALVLRVNRIGKCWLADEKQNR